MNLNEEVEVLKSVPIFAKMEMAKLKLIAFTGERMNYSEGQELCHQGDPGDAMYVIISGEARVDVGGRFHILRPGDFFGEMALIAPSRRMATVKAVAPVRALRIPAEDFQTFLLEHPTVALAMLKAIILRLREVEQRIDAWMA